MPQISFDIPAPFRGINTREEGINMPAGFLEDGENFEPFATFAKNRKGFSKYNSTIESGKPLSAKSFVGSDDSQNLLYNILNRISNVTSTAITVLHEMEGIPTKSQFVTRNQEVLFSSDVENRAIDPVAGTTRSLGLPKAPVFANTDFTLSGSSVNGWANANKKVRYVQQFLNISGTVELDKSGITVPKVSTEGTVTFGTTDSDVEIGLKRFNHPNVTTIRVFRTAVYDPAGEVIGDVPKTFFFIGDFTNSNQTVIDSTLDTDFIGESQIAGDFEFDPIPAGGEIAAVEGRVFGIDPVNPSDLVFSHNSGGASIGIFRPAGEILREFLVTTNDAGNLVPQFGAVISESGIQRTPNGQPITGLFAGGRDLYIWTANKTYRLRNAGGARISQMEEISDNIGLLSHNAVIDKNNVLIINTNESGIHGIRMLSGSEYSADIVDYAHEADMGAIEDFTKTFMIPFKDQIWMGFRDDATKDFNNKTMCFKVVGGRWVYFKHTIQLEVGAALGDGTVVTFDGEKRFFFKQDDTFQDDGVAFTTRMRFNPLRGRHPTDIIEAYDGFLIIEQDFFLEMRYFVDENIGGSLLKVFPNETPFAKFQKMKWNIGDPLEGAPGFFNKDKIEFWNIAFDGDMIGNKITLELRKKDNAEFKFKRMKINAMTRVLR